jgi:phosphoribosylformylglycinamidine synthase
VSLPETLDPFVALFSESTARALVAVAVESTDEFAALCTAEAVPVLRLGETVGGDDAALDVTGQFRVPLDELRTAWSATLPDALGH